MKSPPHDPPRSPFPNLALLEGMLFKNELKQPYHAIPLYENGSREEPGHSNRYG
jgi:hypothetical protein